MLKASLERERNQGVTFTPVVNKKQIQDNRPVNIIFSSLIYSHIIHFSYFPFNFLIFHSIFIFTFLLGISKISRNCH